MDSSNTRVAKVLRDARAEIARPMRPNTPRDPRMMSTASFSSGGGSNHNTPTTTSNGRFPTNNVSNNSNNNIKSSSPTTGKLAQSSSSGALPPLPVNNNTSARNNNNNNIMPLPPMHPSTSSSTFSASNDISAKRTATAGAGSSSDGIANSNNATGSGTFNFFDVKPPPPKKNFNNTISSNTMKTTKENNHNIDINNNIGSRQQQQQQQQCEDPDQEQERLMPTRLLRKRRNSQLSSAGNSDIAVSESSTADSSSNFGVDENNNINNNTTTTVTDPEKYKSLILDLDSEDIRKKGHAAKEILSLLFTWKKKTSNEEEEEDDDEDDEIDTDKLRTKALEVALSLFRDNSSASNNNNSDTNANQQQQQQFGWEVAKEVKLVDMALRYAETRPFGSVDFTLAVSCVKTAAETPQCIQSVFTAGGIPVLKNVLDTAVEKLTTTTASNNNNNNPIITLSVALTLQTLSSLSANYSAQIIKCGVCQPCVDLAPFVEHDDRAAAALCSLAAKLSADDTQAVSIWREIKHGSFASKLARCVTLRWKRMYEKSAKITGSTIVARGLLAIALLIADGSTPLDQVAADNNFVTSLCTEFDEMCATMNPATADEHEELVNALRVISGVSVNSVGGHVLADHPSLKELVTDLLMDLEPDSETGQSVLLLALVCISNFTFYCFQPSDQRNYSNTASDFSSSGEEDRDTPIISDSVALLWLENLLPCLLGILFNDGSSPEALVETTRALGNISRTADGVGACRQHRIDEVVCALLNHEDARIVYNCLGVVTNLSAIAINEGTPKERLPWLPICNEQVTALAEKKCDVSIEYPEVAELAEAARCNIMNI